MGTVVPVFGAPRTGTSLVAEILHDLGCPMGKTFVQPADATWTPTHFWADAAFNRLHEKLVMNGDGLRVIDATVWALYQLEIESREKEFELWGFKDVWLPILWPDIAPRLEHAVLPIFTSRDERAASDSYGARTGATRQKAAGVLQPFRSAVSTIRTVFPTALVVPFEGLVDDPAAWIPVIAGYVGLPFKPSSVDKVLPDWKRF